MKLKRYYFQNAAICGNCNGAGLQGYLDYCRACDGTGVESFLQFIERKKQDLISLRIDYNKCIQLLKSEA